MNKVDNFVVSVCIEDGFAIEKKGGIGRYTIDLINNLRNRKGIKVINEKKKYIKRIRPIWLRRIIYFFWLNTFFLFKVIRNKIKIVYFTNYMVPIIKIKQISYIVSINDVSPILYPSTQNILYRIYFKLVFLLSIFLSNYIVTISNSVKQDILKIRKNVNVKVLYIGIDRRNFYYNKRIKKDNIFLFVGRIERRKNIVYSIKILENVLYNKDYSFIICGNYGYKYEEVIKYIEQSSIKDKIYIYKDIGDKELNRIYNKSSYFIFTSKNEGFGLPLIEALYYDLNVICIDNYTNKEILGDSGIYIPENDETRAADIINNFLNNKHLKTRLINRIKTRKKIFYWDNIINEYIKFFKEII